MSTRRVWFVVLLAAALAAGCSSTSSTSSTGSSTTGSPTAAASSADGSTTSPAPGTSGTVEFTAEVWVDNWFALYANGVKVGEDSVPITTERSFNAETIRFRASYPLTIGLVAKDYKQDDSGLEYIGTSRQQMGDGGVIVQITETATRRFVVGTGKDWKGLVIHRAPLNTSCVSSKQPITDCRREILPEPAGWADPAFDDSGWVGATVYSASAVGTKDGYDTIKWNKAAVLIWTSDLKVDNTILFRRTVATAPTG